MKRSLSAFVLFSIVLSLSVLATGQAAVPNLDDQLFDALQKGDAAAVGQLLDRGANANAQGSTGETPLIVATAMGQVDMVKLLLDHGANVNDKSNDGTTALSLAISQKHPDVEALLRAKGAQ